jgi:hypothetical protein
MKSKRTAPVICLFGLSLAVFLFTGCDSTQGSVNAPLASSMGRPADEIQEAPKSKSYSEKKDVFQAAEYESRVLDTYPNARQIRLRVGEVIEVYRGSAAIGDGQPEMAFFLPPEATSIVQLVVERKGLNRTYFLRGVAAGESVGGVVERRWLSSDGTRPKDAAHQARVQNAIRGEPFLILVQ